MTSMTTTRNVTDGGIAVDIINGNPAICHTCDQCHRDIPPTEPLWRVTIPTGDYRPRASDGAGYPVKKDVSLCRECALKDHQLDYWHDKAFDPDKAVPGWQRDKLEPFRGQTFSTCAGCGRPLGRVDLWPSTSCSKECSRVIRNARRRHGLTDRECRGCGQDFKARADAAYCSAACRQAAYRNRTAGSV